MSRTAASRRPGAGAVGFGAAVASGRGRVSRNFREETRGRLRAAAQGRGCSTTSIARTLAVTRRSELRSLRRCCAKIRRRFARWCSPPDCAPSKRARNPLRHVAARRHTLATLHSAVRQGIRARQRARNSHVNAVANSRHRSLARSRAEADLAPHDPHS